MSTEKNTPEFENPFHGEATPKQRGLTQRLCVDFFEAAHGVRAYAHYSVELTRPTKDDPYSHAISRHGPVEPSWPNKTKFDSWGGMHRVRNEYLTRFHMAMLEAQDFGPGTTFGFRRKFLASDGQTYIFTFRYDGEEWQEITGFPA